MSESQTFMLGCGVVSLLLLIFAFAEHNPITACFLGLWSGPSAWLNSCWEKISVCYIMSYILHDMLSSLCALTNFYCLHEQFNIQICRAKSTLKASQKVPTLHLQGKDAFIKSSQPLKSVGDIRKCVLWSNQWDCLLKYKPLFVALVE